MDFDYSHVRALYTLHPAWKLLRSDHAPLIITFLRRVFINRAVRALSETTLASLLEDELYQIRQYSGEDVLLQEATVYLREWTAKEWLRRFYLPNSDEPHSI